MKTNKLFAALLIGLTVVACSPKQDNAAADGDTTIEPAAKEMTAKDFTPTKAQIDSVSYLLGINFGSFVKGYNFGDINYAKVVEAMKDFAKSKGTQRDPGFLEQFKINPEKMNEVFNSYLEKRHNQVIYENKIKEEKFLASNAKKSGVQVTESGLQYTIEEAGNENRPGPTDTVWVHYTGKLVDGTVFDEVAADAEAVSFTLNRVVPGWSEGLQLIGEGGKVKLFIPSKLGYGESGNNAIEPNSTLVFDVILDKVAKVQPAKPVEAAE